MSIPLLKVLLISTMIIQHIILFVICFIQKDMWVFMSKLCFNMVVYPLILHFLK